MSQDPIISFLFQDAFGATLLGLAAAIAILTVLCCWRLYVVSRRLASERSRVARFRAAHLRALAVRVS